MTARHLLGARMSVGHVCSTCRQDHLTVGEQRIPVEVKYREQIDQHRDTLGLRSFIEKTVYSAPFGVLVTMRDAVRVTDPRIVTVSLPSLLLLR